MEYQYFNTSNLPTSLPTTSNTANLLMGINNTREGRVASLTIVLPTLHTSHFTPPQPTLRAHTALHWHPDMFVWIVRTNWTDGYSLQIFTLKHFSQKQVMKSLLTVQSQNRGRQSFTGFINGKCYKISSNYPHCPILSWVSPVLQPAACLVL